MHNDIQEVLGQNYGVPDDIDEEDLLGELDALEADMALEAETATATGATPSYMQVRFHMPHMVHVLHVTSCRFEHVYWCHFQRRGMTRRRCIASPRSTHYHPLYGGPVPRATHGARACCHLATSCHCRTRIEAETRPCWAFSQSMCDFSPSVQHQ